MRKCSVALVLAFALSSCTPEDLASLIKTYCGIEPSVNDIAKIVVPGQVDSADLLDAAARAFCAKAIAQSKVVRVSPQESMAMGIASISGASRPRVKAVVFWLPGGRAARVRYVGTPRMR